MKRKIIVTADGSSTIYLTDWNEQYHSKHGAIQEAYHVFIKHGLEHLCHSNRKNESLKSVSILEIGFGTGLNAFITLLESEKLDVKINYCGVEAYPVAMDEVNQLNYTKALKSKDRGVFFNILHQVSWEENHEITPKFSLEKQHKLFHEIDFVNKFNIIYFDAFGPRVQPELWTESLFKKMYCALKQEGVLVTYSAKGSVRRAMQTVGFVVERLQGPPGKREMLRATK